ncbi:Serine/threonine-protein kinase tousled-like 2 [Tritrichomonas musculus]|uniref:Serine/threonine-protein kinase tousled-like 2 n=1 Tax=Tritrichomonas musculus TaxID=1915356 RepID=A0ABR2JXW2_9EUKA
MLSQNSDVDLAQYHLLFKIGEGGFSKVYRIYDEKNKKYYAAKICLFAVEEETQESPETRSLFREVNLMSLLNHPTIIKLIGYSPNDFDGDPFPTIITEYASSGSLRNLIEMEKSGLLPH